MVSLQTWLVVTALAAPADVEVVKFTANWCAPCRAMEPVLQQLTQRGIPVRRIDVDQQRELAEQYQVKSLPTLLIVASGQVVDRIEGAVPLESLLAQLDRFGSPPPPSEGLAHANSLPPTGLAPGATVAAATRGNDHGQANGVSVEQLARQATVRLRVEDPNGHSFGTGTIVDVHGQDALVLTCGHIFRDSQGKGRVVVELFTADASGPVEGELIRYDLQRDLALVGLRTNAKLTAVPVAGPNWRATPGQPLFSVGCNHGEDATVMRGRLKAINKYLGPENLTVEGRPSEGRSGGGLFAYDGHLVGVCNAADPEIDEGLYAAFASIHRHLDDAQLSFVYQARDNGGVQLAGGPEAMSGPETVASAAAVSDADAWSSVAARAEAPLPVQAAAAGLAPFESNEAEVICIVRTRDDPTAKSEVVILDRPSRDFLSRLTEERRAQVDRRMTQMRVASPRAGRPLATSAAASGTPDGQSPRSAATRRLQRPVQ